MGKAHVRNSPKARRTGRWARGQKPGVGLGPCSYPWASVLRVRRGKGGSSLVLGQGGPAPGAGVSLRDNATVTARPGTGFERNIKFPLHLLTLLKIIWPPSVSTLPRIIQKPKELN